MVPYLGVSESNGLLKNKGPARKAVYGESDARPRNWTVEGFEQENDRSVQVF